MMSLIALGDTIDEAMNTIQLGRRDSKDTVKSYNTRRVQITSEIEARVSAYFGFNLRRPSIIRSEHKRHNIISVNKKKCKVIP